MLRPTTKKTIYNLMNTKWLSQVFLPLSLFLDGSRQIRGNFERRAEAANQSKINP